MKKYRIYQKVRWSDDSWMNFVCDLETEHSLEKDCRFCVGALWSAKIKNLLYDTDDDTMEATLRPRQLDFNHTQQYITESFKNSGWQMIEGKWCGEWLTSDQS